MDEQNNSMMKFVLPAAVVAIIAVAVIFFYTTQKSSTVPSGAVSDQVTTAPTQDSATTGIYKDGTYSVVGNYVSPGGPREVNITVTLQGDVVTDSTFEGSATDAPSKRFQGEFAEGFKPMVVGKKIDEVQLTKVAGSSLTPKGFMDALEKVKTEAKA
ncbi:MAG: FMN-binding protein [Candidatus Levybacteria bacterium]|nr:FMN-binding protein [Candidatus Levybacteria bacterium]